MLVKFRVSPFLWWCFVFTTKMCVSFSCVWFEWGIGSDTTTTWDCWVERFKRRGRVFWWKTWTHVICSFTDTFFDSFEGRCGRRCCRCCQLSCCRCRLCRRIQMMLCLLPGRLWRLLECDHFERVLRWWGLLCGGSETGHVRRSGLFGRNCDMKFILNGLLNKSNFHIGWQKNFFRIFFRVASQITEQEIKKLTLCEEIKWRGKKEEEKIKLKK